MKVALYCRVSLDEKSDDRRYQNPENQLMPMLEYCKVKGWEPVKFIEQASGGSNRPIFRDMLSRAMMREFDGILIYSFDRFSREGILDTLSYVKRLKSRGIWIKSLREEWFDTQGPFTELMLAQFAWFAEFERKKISDRTKAGITRLKARGKYTGGRPKKCPICGWSHKPTKRCRDEKGSPISSNRQNGV